MKHELLHQKLLEAEINWQEATLIERVSFMYTLNKG